MEVVPPTETSGLESQLESGRIQDVQGFVSAVWSLRRENRHAAAWELTDRALTLVPDDPALRDVAAMLFYDIRIKALADDTDIPTCARLFSESQRVRAAPTSSGGVFGKIYSYRLVALRLAKIVIERDANLALRILETLVVGALSTERKPPIGGGGSPTRLMPSDLDTYYLRLTKALELTGRWQDLLNVEAAAMRALDGSENQQWIVLRLAKAALELGDYAKAKEYVSHKTANPRNPLWMSIIARVQHGIGDTASAIESLKSLIGSQRDLSYQVKNIAQLAVLMAEVDVEISDSLTKLEEAIRTRNSWGIKRELKERLGRVTTPDSKIWDERRLRSWMGQSTAGQSAARRTGVIKLYFNDGSSGFITIEGGGDIFFSLPKDSGLAPPAIGARVSFSVVPSFDKKKNLPSERAINLRVVGN